MTLTLENHIFTLEENYISAVFSSQRLKKINQMPRSRIDNERKLLKYFIIPNIIVFLYFLDFRFLYILCFILFDIYYTIKTTLAF